MATLNLLNVLVVDIIENFICISCYNENAILDSAYSLSLGST